MKALFIGGTGTISSAVSALAVARGVELALLNRGTRGGFHPQGARRIVADRGDPASIRAALGDEHFDVVADWAVYTPQQAAADVALFAGRTDQYLFISSASAYQKPPTHHLVTESTPLANPYWQYSRDKIACEDRLMREYREHGFPVTIVRPSHTYGPGRVPFAVGSSNQPWTIVDRMRRGTKIIVQGDGTSLWTMTHNTDFAKGFVGLMGNTHAIGHAVHITSDEVLTWDQIAGAIGHAAGVDPRIVHIPSEFIAAFKPEELGNLLGDKARCAVFDNSKIRSLVPGYLATLPFSEGIRQSVAWLEQRPDLCTIDEGFNSLADRIIEAYETGLRLAGPAPLPLPSRG